MNKQLFRFTLFLLASLSLPSIAAGQAEILAVSSTNNPAVGDTLEIAINITGASSVSGYDFKLTFDPTKLEFITIENADYLPPGALAFDPIVESDSVQFAALVLTGAAEGDGTLAVATFKVLADTETTVRFERVEIGDQDANPITIASITGVTINSTPSTTDSTTEMEVTSPTADDNMTSTTTAGQVEISAVSSTNNPAVGDTLEIAINITGASSVSGYDFKLTFDPTKLEFITIENADYLPPGALAFDPIVESDSVQFAALVLTGAAEGDGTLAVATFKVLADTETTVRFERVEIGDQDANPITIASITGVTINSTPSTTDSTTEMEVTSPTADDNMTSTTTAGQVEISAVSSTNNPAVGDTLEIAINITGASSVSGYDFKLTFDPTKLEFITIENADYLPPGALAFDPIVESGSVQFAALVLTGAAEGDGTLAVTTFKVLADTETTVRFERVEIGDQDANPITIASITGVTINRAAPVARADIEYLLSMSAGINLMHLPLKVTAVDGVAWTITSISELYDILGGASTVNFITTYDSRTQEWRSYLGPVDRGTLSNAALTDDKGIIVSLKIPVSMRLRGSALGTNGNSIITLNSGLNVVGLPLRDSRVMRVSDLFAFNGIGSNVSIIILTADGEFKSVGRADDDGDIQITGGQSFILNAQRAAMVTIYGDGWTNVR